jgi:hypothetical protein
MRRTWWIGLWGVAVLVPVLALAGMSIPPFEGVDTNGDGIVDREEFQAVFPKAGPKAYETIAGQDGLITPEGWETFREVHRKGERMYGPNFHEKGGGQPGGATGIPQ